ncbi:MAG TPA: hypothetical protein VGD64_11340 [Acidisarcina sp.]
MNGTSPGTVDSLGNYTAAANFSGTATVTATSTQGSPTVSGSDTVTVNPAVATVGNFTSITPNSFYLDGAYAVPPTDLFTSLLTGTNLGVGDKVRIWGGIFNDYFLPPGTGSTSVTIISAVDQRTFAAGHYTYQDFKPLAVTGGTTAKFTFLGSHKVSGYSSTGEKYVLQQADGTVSGGFVWRYTANNTPDGGCSIGSNKNSLAVDDKTGLIVIDGYALDSAGPSFTTTGTSPCTFSTAPSPLGIPAGNKVTDNTAKNGYAVSVLTSIDSVIIYDLTGGALSTPVVTTIQNACDQPGGIKSSQPWAAVIENFGTESDAFIACRGGTPALYKYRLPDGLLKGSLAFPGFTPINAFPYSATVGGLHLAGIDGGIAAGTVLAISTADQKGVSFDGNLMKVNGSIPLPGIPARVLADPTNGVFIVGFDNPSSGTTDYFWVDPLTLIKASQPVSTSQSFPAGFELSQDAKTIYVYQGSQTEPVNNQ